MAALVRYRALALAALTVVGGTVAAGSAARSAAAAEPRSGGLAWVDCDNGFQCTRLEVPLDHARPDGTTIQIALTRKPALSGASKGAVVVNAGTQGGGGVAFVQSFSRAVAALNRDFDVVGLDTRGVGNSQPLVQCVTFAEERVIEAPLSAAHTLADRDSLVQEAAGLAAGCQRRSGQLLPYLSSTSSARDLDLVRAALGEPRLRFLGVSGGSILGQLYLTLFPGRVHTMAFDSPFDAKQFVGDPFRFDVEQMVATERTLGTFFDWCRTTPALCAFGDGDPRAAFDALLAKTRQNRIDNPGRWDVVTDGSLVDYVSGAMLFPEQWPQLGQQLAAMAVQPVPMVPLQEGDDRGFAEYYSQTCLDRDFPTSLAAFDRQLLRAVRAAPTIGGRYGYAEFKCRQWPAEAAERTDGPWVNPARRPLLVLTGNDDPLAPHRRAVRLAHRLHAGLIDLRASGHIQLGRTPCADERVRQFFLTGRSASYTACSVPLPGH